MKDRNFEKYQRGNKQSSFEMRHSYNLILHVKPEVTPKDVPAQVLPLYTSTPLLMRYLRLFEELPHLMLTMNTILDLTHLSSL